MFPIWGNTEYQSLIWKCPGMGILCLFKCRESFLNEGARSQQQNAGRFPLQFNIIEVINIRTSLAVYWLKTLPSKAGGAGSSPGPGAKILHALAKTRRLSSSFIHFGISKTQHNTWHRVPDTENTFDDNLLSE